VANQLREMTSDGGGAAGNGNVRASLNVQTCDTRGLELVLIKNAKGLQSRIQIRPFCLAAS